MRENWEEFVALGVAMDHWVYPYLIVVVTTIAVTLPPPLCQHS